MAQIATPHHVNKFYRSIQYKSASLDIKPHKLKINADKLPMFQIKKTVTSKNYQSKSKRNLFHSEQNLNHIAKSLSQSLSKIHQSDLNNTVIPQANPQNQIAHNLTSCSYIQTFQQLIQSEQKHTSKRKKLGALSIKLDSLKTTSKIDKIALPNIIQYENSQFTALDPIRLPINSIKEDIQKTRKSMEECPNQLKAIRWEMKEFHDRNLKSMQQFESESKQGIKKLWSKLRQNSVYHQGFIMRMRREIKGLQSFIPEFKNQLENTKQNQILVQKIIFETAPFELTRNERQKNKDIDKNEEYGDLQSDYF